MLKTLVEFYDEENLENVFSLLSMTYDRVLFITFSEDKTDEIFENDTALKRFIKSRAPHLKADVLTVEQKTFMGIVGALSKAVNKKDAFDFDVTGGSEMVIAAIGHVFASSENPNLSIHQYDIKTGDTVFRHPEFEVLKREQSAPKLTVPEIVALYGGKVTAARDDMRPNINKIRAHTMKLFDAVKKHSKEWNSFCTFPSEEVFMKDKTQVKRFAENGNHMNICRKIGDALEKAGLISDIEISKEKGRFYYAYTLNCGKDLYCLYRKSGNLLEYYTYIATTECGEYTDACMSVEMDIDGIITTDNTDTTNEIDVMASSGHLPVCISCKNRAVINEHLYEISAVAESYCGKYAIPVIVSTSKNLTAIKKRAQAMGIVLIENLAEITYGVFKQNLKAALKQDE